MATEQLLSTWRVCRERAIIRAGQKPSGISIGCVLAPGHSQLPRGVMTGKSHRQWKNPLINKGKKISRAEKARKATRLQPHRQQPPTLRVTLPPREGNKAPSTLAASCLNFVYPFHPGRATRLQLHRLLAAYTLCVPYTQGRQQGSHLCRQLAACPLYITSSQGRQQGSSYTCRQLPTLCVSLSSRESNKAPSRQAASHLRFAKANSHACVLCRKCSSINRV
ncbi:hypothetical protein DUNSADRAFT_260 [Dunaliella salina]|uniref:Encoded protein n=1 Tax=Dunaliella salina TaxID=3046 RepID=A0ABQ7FZ87_DUNSA|nr:hypothetical protein DUNSADRAFT_260 [Dunaliella salina]|eukprot:KAF5827673.1 hypothetical protein DUNSADRAFT_260 [Dunaliella salina]